MPATADNICKKSSQFHFVNDYLYRTVDNEDGSNSSGIYADRYYPDGYEHGVPFDMSEVVHDQPNYQPFNRRQASIVQRERDQYRGQGRPQNRDRYPNENRRVTNNSKRFFQVSKFINSINLLIESRTATSSIR